MICQIDIAKKSMAGPKYIGSKVTDREGEIQKSIQNIQKNKNLSKQHEAQSKETSAAHCD